MKDYKGAIEDANLCIKCKKDWNKGYFRLATAQEKSGDYLGAFNTVNKGLKIVANDKNLLDIRTRVADRAAAQEKASRFDEAVGYYQQAIELSENGEKIWIDSYNNMS